MEEKLTWGEIKERYNGEWVELIDVDWDDFEQNPRTGVVRLHAKKRRELHELIMRDPVDSSAIVYVGKMKFPEGTIFSANLHQYMGGKR